MESYVISDRDIRLSFFRMQYDDDVLDKNIVLKWCLDMLQKCTSEQIYVFILTLKGLIKDFAMSVSTIYL